MYSPFIIRKFHAKLTKKKVSLDSFSQAPTLVFFLIDQQYLVKKKKKKAVFFRPDGTVKTKTGDETYQGLIQFICFHLFFTLYLL